MLFLKKTIEVILFDVTIFLTGSRQYSKFQNHAKRIIGARVIKICLTKNTKIANFGFSFAHSLLIPKEPLGSPIKEPLQEFPKEPREGKANASQAAENMCPDNLTRS